LPWRESDSLHEILHQKMKLLHELMQQDEQLRDILIQPDSLHTLKRLLLWMDNYLFGSAGEPLSFDGLGDSVPQEPGRLPSATQLYTVTNESSSTEFIRDVTSTNSRPERVLCTLDQEVCRRYRVHSLSVSCDVANWPTCHPVEFCKRLNVPSHSSATILSLSQDSSASFNISDAKGFYGMEADQKKEWQAFGMVAERFCIFWRNDWQEQLRQLNAALAFHLAQFNKSPLSLLLDPVFLFLSFTNINIGIDKVCKEIKAVLLTAQTSSWPLVCLLAARGCLVINTRASN